MGQVNHKLFYYYCECWLLLFIAKQDLIKKDPHPFEFRIDLQDTISSGWMEMDIYWNYENGKTKQNSYLKSSIFKELIIFTQVPTKYSWKSTFNDFG